jgi:imidazolonepropionase-like amidohydrolase
MAGGGVASPTDRITSTQFSLEELRAIVEEAGAANIPVMAHAYTPRAIGNAVEAGVSSIEHGNLLNDEAARAMADAGTCLVPTLLTYEMLQRDGQRNGMSAESVAKVDEVLEAGKRSVAIAKNHKVKIAFGTDCLAEMREPQLDQFRLLQESGMTPTEILQSATCNAAELLDRKGELGVLKEGALADVLVVTGNPLQSTQPFLQWNESCVAIFKQGRLTYDGRDKPR